VSVGALHGVNRQVGELATAYLRETTAAIGQPAPRSAAQEVAPLPHYNEAGNSSRLTVMNKAIVRPGVFIGCIGLGTTVLNRVAIINFLQYTSGLTIGGSIDQAAAASTTPSRVTATQLPDPSTGLKRQCKITLYVTIK
jgi:hypothetical protein